MLHFQFSHHAIGGSKSENSTFGNFSDLRPGFSFSASSRPPLGFSAFAVCLSCYFCGFSVLRSGFALNLCREHWFSSAGWETGSAVVHLSFKSAFSAVPFVACRLAKFNSIKGDVVSENYVRLRCIYFNFDYENGRNLMYTEKENLLLYLDKKYHIESNILKNNFYSV